MCDLVLKSMVFVMVILVMVVEIVDLILIESNNWFVEMLLCFVLLELVGEGCFDMGFDFMEDFFEEMVGVLVDSFMFDDVLGLLFFNLLMLNVVVWFL